MNKQEIIQVAEEIKDLLKPKLCENPERLQFLYDKYNHIPAIKQLFNNDYDNRAVNKGWGSPNCSCHISPPCQSCVDWTNDLSEKEA